MQVEVTAESTAEVTAEAMVEGTSAGLRPGRQETRRPRSRAVDGVLRSYQMGGERVRVENMCAYLTHLDPPPINLYKLINSN